MAHLGGGKNSVRLHSGEKKKSRTGREGTQNYSSPLSINSIDEIGQWSSGVSESIKESERTSGANPRRGDEGLSDLFWRSEEGNQTLSLGKRSVGDASARGSKKGVDQGRKVGGT